MGLSFVGPKYHPPDSFSFVIEHDSLLIQNDRVDAVANPAGDRVTPACVGWSESGETVTASAAKQLSVRQPRRAVKGGSKAIIGRKSEQQVRRMLICHVVVSSSFHGLKKRLNCTDF